jgi:hypothetical protein
MVGMFAFTKYKKGRLEADRKLFVRRKPVMIIDFTEGW